MILDLLAQILDDAVEYELLAANPARGKRRRLKVPKPARSFLEPDMVVDFYLRHHLHFFPRDAVGPANSSDGLGRELQVRFAGESHAIPTDIAGGNKLMFRCRGRIAAFFRRQGLRVAT